MNTISDSPHFDDRLVRLIGIPFFGIVIPSATELVKLEGSLSVMDTLNFLLFILVAGIIWQGNRWLFFKYYPRLFKSPSKLRKYTLMTGLNIFYTVPVALGLLLIWKVMLGPPQISLQNVFNTVVLITICVIFITNIYEKATFFRHQSEESLLRQQLEHSKTEAELQALKSQIDPHFIFNTLNSVTYLVAKDAGKATLFIENLAEVFRYILRSKENDLILLRDELDFMLNYASLMELRHESGFSIKMDPEVDHHSSKYLILPVSLLVALENAVKHNEVSNRYPLVIKIAMNDEKINISNMVRVRNNQQISTGLGLKNLNERFRIVMGKGIEVANRQGTFNLELPLLKLRG